MESVSKVSSLMDPARDLTNEAVQAVGLSKKLTGASSTSSRSLPFAKLKALLDSRSDREILDGLRRVISMVYQNKPCLPYFSSVVKNVANPNIEVKKLVYIYLLHYAESDPDLALLSVNAIQKSLTDQNPQVRALALRTMSGMRVPVISQIVSLAIKRGVGDMSPQVRKAAALAIPKCYRLDPNSLPQLLEFISTLLADKQYYVVGPAVQAFLELCPERMDLIHKHYKGLVKKLVDMDEWGQLATIRLLMFYSRKCFPPKLTKVTKTTKKGFYDDEPDEVVETDETAAILDPDLELFLKACRTLLFSRNPAVIIAVSSCFLYLDTTRTYVKEAVGPLVALLRSSTEIAEVALANIVCIALTHAELFVPYTSHFLITTKDTESQAGSSNGEAAVWKLKLELLTLVFPHAESHLKSVILAELEHFSHSPNGPAQVSEAVRAIGRCAQSQPSDPRTSARCLKVLLNQISSFDSVLVSEVLTVLRHLIQQDPTAHKKTVVRLARNLDTTTSPAARATIIWLVGEFAVSSTENDIAADVLRILVRNFADESEETKLQIVLLAAKVYLYHLQAQAQNQPQSPPGTVQNAEQTAQETMSDQGGWGTGESIIMTRPDTDGTTIDSDHVVPKLWEYIISLVRYDQSYDLRDRMRLLRSLLATPSSTQLASLLILAPKPVPQSPSPSESRKGLTLGSTTLVLGKDVAGINGLPGYEAIPAWVESGSEPDPRLREPDGLEKEEYVSMSKRENTTAASKRLDEAVREQGLEKVVAKGTNKGKKSLDAWLDESEAEGDTETETESEEESSEDEEESSEEEETDEDSEQEDTTDDEQSSSKKHEQRSLIA